MDETAFTPLIGRDLIGPSTSMTGAMMGLNNPYMHTNFLGGVTMAPGITSDVYTSIQREKMRNQSGLKASLMGIGGFIAACFVGHKFHKLGKSIAKLFKRNP